MKANRRLRDEHAVSNVLGGILFFSLVFVFLVVVRVDYVPVWEEDREARHMGRIQGQLAEMKSEVDRQAGNRTAVAVAHSLSLGERTSSRFFTPTITPGTAAFTPGVSDARLASDELRIIERDGRRFGAVNESWVSITGPTEIDNVDEVFHLRIRVLDPNPGSGGAGPTGDSVTLTVTDADGDFAGDLTIYTVRHPSGYTINTMVRTATGEVLFDQGESLFNQDSPAFWWIDAMAPELHFVDVLAAAAEPFTLALTESGLDGEYSITYIQESGTGQNLVGNAGITVSDFSESLRAGVLKVEAHNSFFEQQTYWFENGAVLLQQADETVMRIGPAVRLETVGSSTRLSLTVPALTGDSDSVSHPGVVSVHTEPRTTRQITGTAPMLTYQLSTAFPTVWAAWLQDTAEAAGLDSSAGEFTLATSADSVTFTVYGQTSDPSSTDHDLSVELHQARISVRLST